MRRFTFPVLSVGLAAALLAVLAYGVSSQGENSSIDSLVARHLYPVAPSSTMRLAVLGSNRTEDLSAFRGRVILVNIFASWCQPCAAEAPVLHQVQRLLVQHGGTIVGVTYQDASSSTEEFVRQYHVAYPVLRDVNGNFARSFGTEGVPESFLIDRTGRIRALERSELTTKWVDQTLPRILANPS
jgi:cytochrome c biogenesis protein CcmG/thiol:disulfide interchange protein DsbE